MNISAVMSQLMAFHELYGDLPVYQVVGQTYAALQQLPWLAAPSGAIRARPITSSASVSSQAPQPLTAQTTNHREHREIQNKNSLCFLSVFSVV